MSSTIYTDWDRWDVTNVMYPRVLDFACHLALEGAARNANESGLAA